MNLIAETKKKLAYQEANLIDLKECMKQPVSSDCKKYLQDKLEKTEKEFQYFTELLDVLEIANKVL